MSTATPTPPTQSEDTPGEGRAARWALRILMGVAAASSLVWVGAILFASTGTARPDDFLGDRRFFDAAEPVCDRARDDLEDLPRPEDTVRAAERLDVIRRSTDRLEEMVDELRPLVPDNQDGKAISLWLDHWGIHLDDRRDFMSRVERRGTDERFLETTLDGGQISSSINRFADVNEMPSCGTPGDV